MLRRQHRLRPQPSRSRNLPLLSHRRPTMRQRCGPDSEWSLSWSLSTQVFAQSQFALPECGLTARPALALHSSPRCNHRSHRDPNDIVSIQISFWLLLDRKCLSAGRRRLGTNLGSIERHLGPETRALGVGSAVLPQLHASCDQRRHADAHSSASAARDSWWRTDTARQHRHQRSFQCSTPIAVLWPG